MGATSIVQKTFDFDQEVSKYGTALGFFLVPMTLANSVMLAGGPNTSVWTNTPFTPIALTGGPSVQPAAVSGGAVTFPAASSWPYGPAWFLQNNAVNPIGAYCSNQAGFDYALWSQWPQGLPLPQTLANPPMGWPTNQQGVFFPAFYNLAAIVKMVTVKAIMPYGADDKLMNPTVIQFWGIGAGQNLIAQGGRTLQGPTIPSQQELTSGKEEQARQAIIGMIWPILSTVQLTGGMPSILTGTDYDALVRRVISWRSVSDAFATWYMTSRINGITTTSDFMKVIQPHVGRLVAESTPVHRIMPIDGGNGAGLKRSRGPGRAGAIANVVNSTVSKIAGGLGDTVEKGIGDIFGGLLEGLGAGRSSYHRPQLGRSCATCREH